MKNNIVELSTKEIEMVSGGVVFAAAFAPAFIKGAKWGAAVVLSAYALHKMN
jgi:hypothetical protein